MTPGPSVRIRCADDDARAMLQAWADNLRLSIPVPIVLDVAVGNPLETTGARAGGKVFRQPGVAIYTTESGAVHARWNPARATAALDPGSTTARVTLSRGAMTRLDECARVFLSTVLILLLRRVGWHHLHGAIAIDPSGKGWLIVGDSGAGKSTTTALLAASGWRVGNDDVVFLREAGSRDRVLVAAARTPIALREDMSRRLGSNQDMVPGRGKMIYWPEDLGGRWVDRVEPDVIMFVSASRDGTDTERSPVTRAEPMAAPEATARLVRASAWVMLEPRLAQGHLELLARLARQARCFRVQLAEDLFTSPERLQELIA